MGTEPDAVPQHTDSDSFPRFHVNAMRAWGGPFDITLDFGYRADPEIEPATQVRISMSWEHVAATVKLLQAFIDEYEQQAGKIPDLEKLRIDEEVDSA